MGMSVSSLNTKTTYMAQDLLPLLSVCLVNVHPNNNALEVTEMLVGVPDDIAPTGE